MKLFTKFSRLEVVEVLSVCVMIAALAAFLVPTTAKGAASSGFDYFETPTTLATAGFNTPCPTNMTSANNGFGITNGPMLVRSLIGAPSFDGFIYNNNVGVTITFYIQGSPDTTNWTSLTNWAIVGAPSQKLMSNNYYGGGVALTSTNYLMLTGTSNTPNPAVSGYATQSLTPLGYTNASYTFTSGTSTYFEAGFVDASGLPAYIRTLYVANYPSTNIIVGGTFKAMNVQGNYK